MATTEAGFSAQDVMALRRKTGLGMMDCKKALAENHGDTSAAEQWLRQTLMGKMEGRTERATGEGRIGIIVDGAAAVILEIRTETDFTARNEEFVSMVRDITRLALNHPAGPVRVDDEITRRIDDIRIRTGENVNFARGEKIEGGSFGTYLHHDGKQAAIIQLDGTADDDVLTGICQHIVAHVPTAMGINEGDIPADRLDEVRDAARKDASASGKPAEIVVKIAEGKVRKFLQQNTLLNQIYVKDPAGKATVGTILPAGVSITRFLRYTVGRDLS